MQQWAVWSLPPQGDSEGPTFIFHAAPPPEALPTTSLLRRSWHTISHTSGRGGVRSPVPLRPAGGLPALPGRSWLLRLLRALCRPGARAR